MLCPDKFETRKINARRCRQNGKNENKALYLALSIGKKEALGFHLSDTEGAKFWMSVLTDLKNRGVEDIFIMV